MSRAADRDKGTRRSGAGSFLRNKLRKLRRGRSGMVLLILLGLLCCCGGLALPLVAALGTGQQAAYANCRIGLPGPSASVPPAFGMPRWSGSLGALIQNGERRGLPRAAPADPGRGAHGLTAEQASNAQVIVSVGQRMRVSPRGWVIAIATALQESNLYNLGHLGDRNDHDSLGLFQQRPSQGWGTPEQILNPQYAATKFYERLLKVPGWQTMALTDAAQAVQRSAYPDAYAKHEARAAAIVASYSGGVLCDEGDGVPVDGIAGLPPGFTLPAGTPAQVVTAITWALQQLGTPYSFGGTCTAPHSGIPRYQCDCSSLMQQAYRAAGVSLPRTTIDQVHAGSPINGVGNLLPGDLIFIPGSLGTMANPRHVGMYLGSGLIVLAPKTGDVVKISRLSSWADQIAAMRRIVT